MSGGTWEARKLRTIGGTDAAAIAGASRFGDAFDVWLRVTGRDTRYRDSAPMRWGNRLEDAVRSAYQEDTGRRLAMPGPGRVDLAPILERCELHELRRASGERAWMLTDRERPWIGGSLDGLIEAYVQTPEGLDGLSAIDASGPGVWDGKTTAILHEDWHDGVPAYERAQVEWYLGLTGLRWGSLGVFHGTRQPLLVRDFAACPELFEAMLEAVERFWHDHVLADVPPYVFRTGERLDAMIAALYPEDDGTEVVLGEEFAALELQRRRHLEQAKAEKAAADLIARQIKAEMGRARDARIAGTELRLEWSTIHRAGYTVEPTTYRKLRAVDSTSTGDEE